MGKIKASSFTFLIRYNSTVPLELVVFFEGSVYQEMMEDEYTCSEKAAKARSLGNVFLLNRYTVPNLIHKDDGWVTAQESLGFLGARPRWYYFFVMNCQPAEICLKSNNWCQGPIDMEYTLLLTNGAGYMKHFSADEIGILPTAVTFGLVYFFLIIYVTIYIIFPLKKKRKLHQTVKMYLLSLILYVISMWFDVSDLAEEGTNGQRCEACQFIALNMRVISDSLVLCTCILLAKGWTVVRRKISASGRVKIAIFMTLYVTAGLFSVGNQFSTSNDANNLFRTPTQRLLTYGWFTFFIRLAGFVWFTRSAITTRNFDAFHRQRNFFLGLFCSMGSWILALPFAMLIAINMDIYYRARWMYAMEIGSGFLGHLFLAFIFRPSRNNKFFPFAFKTAAMEAQERWNATRGSVDNGGANKTGEEGPGLPGPRPKSMQLTARRPRDSQSSITETGYGLSNANISEAGKLEGAGSSMSHSMSGGNIRRRSNGAQSVSGGLAVDPPAVRVRNLATSLRKKLGIVYEVADQLEEELGYLDEAEDETGALITGATESVVKGGDGEAL